MGGAAPRRFRARSPLRTPEPPRPPPQPSGAARLLLRQPRPCTWLERPFAPPPAPHRARQRPPGGPYLVEGDGVEGHGALGVQRTAAGQRQAEQAEEQGAGGGRRSHGGARRERGCRGHVTARRAGRRRGLAPPRQARGQPGERGRTRGAGGVRGPRALVGRGPASTPRVERAGRAQGQLLPAAGSTRRCCCCSQENEVGGGSFQQQTQSMKAGKRAECKIRPSRTGCSATARQMSRERRDIHRQI